MGHGALGIGRQGGNGDFWSRSSTSPLHPSLCPPASSAQCPMPNAPCPIP
ncbi:MAG: hypothetical protein F6J93_33325 [Oscillatoria sp. SIO1A7]|nr:hypothetical protein [Oscillatoria sp. SIO1A7]